MKIKHVLSLMIVAGAVAAMVGAAQNAFAEKGECPEVCTRDKVAADDSSCGEKSDSAACEAVTAGDAAKKAANSCDVEKETGACPALTQLTCAVGTCEGDDEEKDTYVSSNTEPNNPEFRWPFRSA